MSVVTKLTFQPRQIMVSLDDGPEWPLRPHPAVIRYVEGLVAEIADLRPAAAELAELRLHAERAGHNPMELLSGMVRKIERLTEALDTERAIASQRIVELRHEVTQTELRSRRDAFLIATKIVREHCQHCPVEAATVLGPVTSKLEDQAALTEMQVARMTG